MMFTRGLMSNAYGAGAPMPLPMAHVNYVPGPVVRGGARSLTPALPTPMFDITDPKTWTLPVIPGYRSRGL